MRRVVLLAAVFAALAGARRAPAYETATAQDSRWPGNAFTFHVNASSFAGDGLGTTGVAASFEAWEQDSVSILTTTRGTDTTRVAGADGFNDVVYENTSFAGGASVLAVTSLASLGADLVEADLTVNGVNFAWGDPLPGGCTSAFDLRATVTHEAGHALGLGHSSESLSTCDTGSGSFDAVYCDATMFFASGPCDADGQSLECDDRAGIRFLYAPGGAPRADWAAESFSASPLPATVAPGQLVTVTGTAANRGSLQALAGTAALYVEASPGVTTPANRVQTTSLLSTGSCRTRAVALNTTFTAADAGTRWLVVKLDDGATTAEHSETDNIVSFGPYVVDAGPRLAVSDTTLEFDGAVGGPAPPGQSVTVTNDGSGSFTWSAVDDRSWITVAPGSGAPGAFFTVSVNSSGLSAGTHSGTVTVTAPGVLDSPRQVAVTLDLVAGPVLEVTPPSLSFVATAGGALPASKQLAVANTGGGSLSWTASDDAAWLSVSPGAGSAGQSIGVSVTTTAMAPGQYIATVTVVSAGSQGSPQLVGVTLDLQDGSAELEVAPPSLDFAAALGGAAPPPQDVAVSNGGAGAMAFTASADRSWIDVSPGAGSAPADVEVSVDPSGLGAGVHDGTVTIVAAGAVGSPAQVPVRLVVSAGPSIDAQPPSLSFSGVAGGADPAGQDLVVRNDGAGTLTYAVTDGAPWLSATPSGGSLIAGASRVHRVTAALGSLPAGTYQAAVSVTDGSADDSPKLVPVTLQVFATPPLSLSTASVVLAATAAAPIPPAQAVTVSTSGSSAPWTVTTNQSWLVVSPAAGAGDGSFGISADATGVAFGTHFGSVTVTAPQLAQSPQSVSVRFDVAPGPRLAVSPTSADWTVTQGDALPAGVTFSVSNGGTGAIPAFSVTGAPTWLQLTPAGGSVPGSFSARPLRTDLAPGHYTALLRVQATGAYDVPRSIALTYDVLGPSLAPSPDRVTFELRDGVPVGGASRTVTVGGGAPGALPWTARATRPWIQVTPGSGNSGTTFTVSLAAGNVLPEGVHDAAVVLESPGSANSPAPVPVTVIARTAELPSVHPVSLALHAAAGQPPRPAARMAVDDAGSSGGAWQLESTPAWLRASTTTGVSGAALQLDVDGSALAPGSQTGEVVVASGAERVRIPVAVQVHGAPFLVADPSSVDLATPVAGLSREETVSITNAGAAPSSFTATTTQPWLRATPSGGTAPASVRVSVDAASLARGSHAAEVVLRAGTNELRVPVRVTVVAAGAAVADFGASVLQGCAPLAVAFQDLSSGAASSWTWSFGDGATSVQRSPLRVYDRPGTFEVTLTAQGGGDKSTRKRVIVVRQTPLAHAGRDRAVAFEPGGLTRVTLADARAQAAAPARLASVSWTTPRGTFADTGTTTSSLERPTLQLAAGRAGTTAVVTLTAVDDTGCSSTDTATVSVLGDLDVDLDSRRDFEDVCPLRANSLQDDFDRDGLGDSCDSCAAAWDPLALDLDADGIGDACDSAVAQLVLVGGPARSCEGMGRLRLDVAAPIRTRRVVLELIGQPPEGARAVGAARAAGGTTAVNADPAVVELRVPAGVGNGRLMEIDVPVVAPGPALTWTCGDATISTAWDDLPAVCGSAALTLRPDADIAPIGARDGVTTVGDVVRLLQASVGLVVLDPDEQARADVAPGTVSGTAWTATPDCAISVGDVIVALRASVGLIDF